MLRQAIIAAVILGPVAASAAQAPRVAEIRILPRAQAYPVDVALDPWNTIRVRTPFTEVPTPDGPALVRIPHYQNPDGSYDNQSDLVNAINGIPCGNECTARSLARWDYRP